EVTTPGHALNPPVGPATLVPREEEVAALAEAINKVEKVTLFVGAGGLEAREEILDVATRIGSPIGHSLRGKEIIQYDNPYDVGMSGLLGYGACQQAMEEADLLVLLGTDFPYADFLPDDVPTAQVDVNAANLGRRTR